MMKMNQGVQLSYHILYLGKLSEIKHLSFLFSLIRIPKTIVFLFTSITVFAGLTSKETVMMRLDVHDTSLCVDPTSEHPFLARKVVKDIFHLLALLFKHHLLFLILFHLIYPFILCLKFVLQRIVTTLFWVLF